MLRVGERRCGASRGAQSQSIHHEQQQDPSTTTLRSPDEQPLRRRWWWELLQSAAMAPAPMPVICERPGFPAGLKVTICARIEFFVTDAHCT